MPPPPPPPDRARSLAEKENVVRQNGQGKTKEIAVGRAEHAFWESCRGFKNKTHV